MLGQNHLFEHLGSSWRNAASQICPSMARPIGFFLKLLSETLILRSEYEEYVKRTQSNTTGFEVRVFDADGNITLSQKH